MGMEDAEAGDRKGQEKWKFKVELMLLMVHF